MSVNYHDQELSFDYLTEIREQSAIGRAEEPEEPLPEPMERNVSLSKLIIDGLGLIEADVKVFDIADLKEQR
jgi:hypothetical protein